MKVILKRNETLIVQSEDLKTFEIAIEDDKITTKEI